MCDFYPQETLSFNSLSDDCPVKLLDYGLMTEKIQDKVILSRRKSRDMKKDVLVKKLELRHLKACLYELDRLGRLDPSNSIIDLFKKKYLVGSKKKIVKFLDTTFVPLVYLEEAFEKQKRGHIQYEIGDRVKYKRKDKVYMYGIISHIIGSGSNKEYTVDHVKQNSYLDEDGKYKFYPNFTEMAYSYNKVPYNKWVSGWDLEFIGKENEASIKLREKLEKDKEESLRKRQEVWPKLESRLLEGYKSVMYDVPNMVNNRATIIETERQLILRALEWPCSGITDDELFEKGVMRLVKQQLIPMCNKAWFREGVNVLDKKVWENVNDEDNLLHKISKTGRYSCGFKIHSVQAISKMIKKYNLLD